MNSIPPSYLKSTNFQNKTGIDAEIDVTFKSGATITYTVAQNSDLTIERTIDQGSFTVVDAILEFTIRHNGNKNTIVANNLKDIQIRTYIIGENGSVTLFENN